MITKRTGHGQTECTRCRELGRFALNWDSFLYTFNGKPYCFDCLMEMLEEKDKTINKVIEEINYLISNCDIVDYQGEKILKILKGDSDE